MNGSRAKPMRERAYEIIREDIFKNRLGPGDPVSEIKISRQIGISRTPVREAITQLEFEGLVVTRNKRKEVRVVTIQQVDEIFDLKKAIEGSMARLAAERATVAQAEDFTAVIGELHEFAKKDFSDPEQNRVHMKHWNELNTRFHESIFTMARNEAAAEFIRRLNYRWSRLRMGLLAMEGRLEMTVLEHEAIGRAISEQSGQLAEQLMIEHLEKLRKSLVNIMEAFQIAPR